MTTPRNDEIQAAIVSYLKTIPGIYNELRTPDYPTGTSSEIREDQWQGTEFEYPNVRVRMISNVPLYDDPSCCNTNVNLSIMAFSQDYSSREADRIAGLVHTYLSGKSFESSGVYAYLKTTNIIPAVRSDVHTWRAECIMQGNACLAPTGTSTPPVVEDWWLIPEEITPDDVYGAYAAVGASSYAASKVNLNNTGTYLLYSTANPGWDTVSGWSFSGTNHLELANLPLNTGTSIIVKFNSLNESASGIQYLFGSEISVSGSYYNIMIYFSYNDGKGNHWYGAQSPSTFYNNGSYPPTEGVWGISFYGFYDNGVSGTVGYTGPRPFTILHTLAIGGDNLAEVIPSLYGKISSIAVYKIPLTFAQFDTIASVMP